MYNNNQSDQENKRGVFEREGLEGEGLERDKLEREDFKRLFKPNPRNI